MISRRKFLKFAIGGTAGLFFANRFADIAQAEAGVQAPVLPAARLRPQVPAPVTLDPTTVEKYVTDLIIPPAMPQSRSKPGYLHGIDYYEIAVSQFEQQILPQPFPKTKVWSYQALGDNTTINYPAFTIEAKYKRPVRVRWVNRLVDKYGKYLPHLLAVDPTLHWANPAGGRRGRDSRPASFSTTPKRYTGPVPMVPHVHGAHVAQEFDGYPEAWWLPQAKNIPRGYAATGTFYDHFKLAAELKLRQKWPAGSAIFEYPNDQRATTLWYHDHTLGMTRLNVYAGPAGFYLVRGGPDDVAQGTLPEENYEIPIVIQDRVFNPDGSLFFPDTREYFDGFAGPYTPDSDISPIWNPEFFGDTMVVNGRSWPKLAVEPRRYRFRFLNGCNSRFLILKLAVGAPDAESTLPIWQIGTEGGFLPAPVQQESLLMALAERADVVIDFSGLPVGTKIYLTNHAPDEPFGGGEPGEAFLPANPDTTGQVMMFEVTELTRNDTSLPPEQIVLPAITPIVPTRTRQVSLNEMMSMEIEDAGPTMAMLGGFNAVENMPEPKMWMDAITENPAVKTSETWEIYNFTADAHPIHIHQTMFQVVNRQALAADEEGVAVQPAQLLGDPTPPEAWETGFKDTVIAYPGSVTRINAKFDLPGLYVWHCHIIDHEDNEMMRPFYVGRIPRGLPHNAK